MIGSVIKPKSFYLPGKQQEIGVLLLHGFTGTTYELKSLGEALQEQGYSVYAPLLKGHGDSPEKMLETCWVDWFVSAQNGYDYLKEKGIKQIVAIGLSMGGLLTLKLAQHRSLAGMVTLCAAIKVRDKRMGMVRYLKHVFPYKKRTTKKAAHIEKELFVYEKTPLACIASLDSLMKNVWNLIPTIKVPILIAQAEQDETVDPCSGQLLYDRIGSRQKKLIHFPQSSHIITLDHEREEVFQYIKHFLSALQSKGNLVTS